MRSLLTVAISMVVAGMALGCGDARKSEPLEGPIELSPDELRGQQLFMKRCNECHPQGEAGIGPALNDKPLPDALIEAKVRDKTGQMPNFSDAQITDEDLDKLVAYLAKVRGHGD